MSLRVAPLAPAVLLVLLGALTSCGDDEQAAGQPGDGASSATSSSLTDAECEALVPASVGEGLGWTDPQPLVNRSTSCEVQWEQGRLRTTRESGGPEGADAAFDAACSALDGVDPDDPSGGISGDFEVCAPSELPGTGVVEAVVRSPEDVVSVVQLAVSTATDSAALRTALSQMAAASSEEMPARR